MNQDNDLGRAAARPWLWLAAALVIVLAVAVACNVPVVTPEDTQEGTPGDTVPVPTASPVEATQTPAAEGEAEDTEPAASPDPGAADLLSPAVASEETYKGLPVGFTEDGMPYRGDPDAPLVMIEYSDFGCPFCSRYFVQTEPALDEAYVRAGHLRVVFHDLPLAELHPNAPAAHAASLCVADQGAELYWNMHAELFRAVEEWQANPDPDTVFARLAEEVGADMAQYDACVADGSKAALVEERVTAAQSQGFNGTPSFQFVRAADSGVFELVGAQPYDEFAGVIDTMLAGDMPQVAQESGQPEPGIPFWASAEGLTPDPERPGYNMAGDLYRGSADAPLTVVEFSDFQCPYCKQFVDETKAVLDETYVDTGQVLWVFKHFPLNIHPQAPAAGVAAECAAEQGQFWEMHHLLFERVGEWSIEDPSPVFVDLAGELGLDVDTFTACLDDPTMMERVNADMAEGAPYVRGTPTFIVLRGERGSIIPGALPADRFSSILDEELAAVEAEN